MLDVKCVPVCCSTFQNVAPTPATNIGVLGLRSRYIRKGFTNGLHCYTCRQIYLNPTTFHENFSKFPALLGLNEEERTDRQKHGEGNKHIFQLSVPKHQNMLPRSLCSH